LIVGIPLLLAADLTAAQAETPQTTSTAPATAPATVQIIDAVIVRRGSRAEPLQATFRAYGSHLPKLALVKRDLVAEHGAVILSTDVAVTSVRAANDTEEVFTLAIKGPPRAGTYRASFPFQIEGLATRTIHIEATFDPIPSVDVGIHSKILILRLIPRLDGKARPDIQQVDLIQNGEGQFRIQDAALSRMETSTGRVMPSGVIAAVKAPGQHPVQVQLQSNVGSVVAGEYTGALTINIENQPRKLEIPIKALVKDSPAGPLGVLVLGFLVAILFGWWNDKGKGLREVMETGDRLQREVQSKRFLQADDRTDVMSLLGDALRKVESGWPAAEIQKLLLDVQTLVSNRQMAGLRLVAERLEPLISDVRLPGPGALVREKLETHLKAAKERLEGGAYKSIDVARSEIEQISGDVDELKRISAEFAALPAERQAALRDALDNAESLDAMAGALTNRLPLEGAAQRVLGRELAQATAGPFDALRFRIRKRLVVNTARALIAAITVGFVLVVGFVTLYVKSPTFGADAMDYITLFLWGSTVETIRGQTVGFEGLRHIVETRP
jgi:hypothetical protein